MSAKTLTRTKFYNLSQDEHSFGGDEGVNRLMSESQNYNNSEEPKSAKPVEFDLQADDFVQPSALQNEYSYESRPLIDCTNIHALSLREAQQDIAKFEVQDVERLHDNLNDYDDVSYWLSALVNLSPTGALLLKNAADYDWQINFDALEHENWSLDIDNFIISLNHSDIKPEALSRSPYFLNTILCDFIRSLRDVWFEEHNEINYAAYNPESILKIERMRAADIEAITLQVAWELRSEGYAVLWRHILGSDIGDMALLFSRFLEHEPSALFDGSGLTHAFKQWYADEERSNNIDRMALEMSDQILFATDDQKAFANEVIDHQALSAIFATPEGRNYLRPMIGEIFKDPYFSAMHDSINEAHLLHIMRDLEICYVGNVPFRDQALADKIFPNYTRTLKLRNK